MSQSRHYEMKDSGVEWIGEMPSHWETIRLKRLARRKAILATSLDGYIGLENVQSWTGKLLPSSADKPEPEGQALIITTGDVIFGKLRPYLAKCHLVQREGCCSSEFMVLDSGALDAGFLKYSMLSPSFINEVNMATYGTKMPRANWEIIGWMPMPVPPLPEQTVIAAYLDDKCATIDALVAEAKATIEEYKAWRASVIFEAVTKGLNPNAEMKDSGVEWIGLIPNDWKLSAVKRHYNITLGKMLESVPQSNEATLENYMCASNIKWGGIDITCNRQMWFSTSEKEEYLLKDGDLLVMEGGSAGTSAIYHGEFAPCYMQNSVNRCRSKDGSLTQFLYYWMFLVYHSGHVESACNRATIMHLTKEKLGRLPFVQVPISEQETIVAHLDSKCAAIDGVIAEKEALIGELETYKKSLIFETVTGKRRVC